MTDKTLRKMSRRELMEMLLEQSKEVERLCAELELAEQKLRSRQILLREAGSIAEASLRLNEVFESAQKAADQYLLNVKRLSSSPEEPR